MDTFLNTCMNEDVLNKSSEYSGTETSDEPLTRQGIKGEETYRAYVEFPACWGYAITMESEKCKVKAIYEQMKAMYENMNTVYKNINTVYDNMNTVYQQMKAIYWYEQIHDKHEQIYAKDEHTCKCITSVNKQHRLRSGKS